MTENSDNLFIQVNTGGFDVQLISVAPQSSVMEKGKDLLSD